LTAETSAKAGRLAALGAVLALGMVLSAGCSSSSQTGPYPAYFTGSGPVIAANVTYVRTDGWHIWADPDKTMFGPIQIKRLQLLVSGGNELIEEPNEGAGGFIWPFPIVKHIDPGNFLFAPGYNPIEMELNSHSPMGDAVDAADAKLAEMHPEAANAPRVRLHDVHYTQGQGWAITFYPLPATAQDVKDGRRVTHGFLIYLLEEPGFWRQLKDAAGRSPESRAAVRIVCESVLKMMDAHDLQWPDYPWKPGHLEVRNWCRQVISVSPSAQDEEDHA
jgi:hypothetical protein